MRQARRKLAFVTRTAAHESFHCRRQNARRCEVVDAVVAAHVRCVDWVDAALECNKFLLVD